jgi:subtilisin family serine protease
MDNYIYDKGVISFKSAGNIGDHVTSPGKALNIITVGALDPLTNGYKDYSSWKNPDDIANQKPEIAMYTDIDLGGSLGIFTGTSAAAPLAAGFTASLLEQHPFFKRQSALVKAVLLTGETIPIPNASSHDADNRVAAKGIVTYPSVAWGTRSAWWERSYPFYNIEFTENNIQANKRYRIAIAWLSRGSYIYSTKWPPHDIDLWVRQNGNVIAQSRDSRNPFEVVDFVTTSNAPLTITIESFANYDKNSTVFLGYHMRENF